METKTETKDKQIFWLKPKNQIYIISAVFGLIVLSLIMFFVFPYIQEIRKNSEDLVSGRNNLAFLRDQVSEVEKFKSNYETYKPNLEKISQLYVDSKNPADFFEFLEKITSVSQIRSEVSLLANPPGAKNVAAIDFQIFSQGEFSKTLKFLEKLETGPYLIEIKNLSITNSRQDSSSKKSSVKLVDANLSIRAYIK